MELTSELTITSRCSDRSTSSATARTGTTHRLSGTVWAITGTTGTAGVEDILARLPKLRKDARANVESVLHELIADKNATIPQICARTGMALRTINNALATLRGAGVIKTRSNDNQGTGTAQTTTPEHAVTTLETTPETTETTPETSEDRIFWARYSMLPPRFRPMRRLYCRRELFASRRSGLGSDSTVTRWSSRRCGATPAPSLA